MPKKRRAYRCQKSAAAAHTARPAAMGVPAAASRAPRVAAPGQARTAAAAGGQAVSGGGAISDADQVDLTRRGICPTMAPARTTTAARARSRTQQCRRPRPMTTATRSRTDPATRSWRSCPSISMAPSLPPPLLEWLELPQQRRGGQPAHAVDALRPPLTHLPWQRGPLRRRSRPRTWTSRRRISSSCILTASTPARTCARSPPCATARRRWSR